MISKWWTDKNLVTIDRSSNSISHHVSKIVIIDRISRLGQETLMIYQKVILRVCELDVKADAHNCDSRRSLRIPGLFSTCIVKLWGCTGKVQCTKLSALNNSLERVTIWTGKSRCFKLDQYGVIISGITSFG